MVQAGDTLSILATRYLGSPQAYNRIVAATAAAAATDASYTAIANPNIIAVGWKLCAPAAGETSTGATSTDAAAQTPVNADSAEDDLPLWRTRLQEGAPHPLTIEYLRSQEYPGSPITIEQHWSPAPTTAATWSRICRRG